MKKMLFINIDGKQNYLESLFYPILEKISNTYNLKIDILNFVSNNNVYSKDIFFNKKINIFNKKYFNKFKFVGKLIFFVYGTYNVFRYVIKNDYHYIMSRSVISSFMYLIVNFFLNKEQIFIYESDGFMIDERIEFSNLKESKLFSKIIYKIMKKIEKIIMVKSNYIIVRTSAAKSIILEHNDLINPNKILVIPNSKNIDNYNVNYNKVQFFKKKYKIKQDDIILIYVGSIGKQYKVDEMLSIYKNLRARLTKIKFIILTPYIKEIKNYLKKHNLFNDINIIIDNVKHKDIPNILYISDVGISLREPTLSQKGVCPLKIIEYLFMGLPIIYNKGIGDMDEILNNSKLFYCINDLNNINYNEIYNFINTTSSTNYSLVRKNIKQIAVENFELNNIIKKYSLIFKEYK